MRTENLETDVYMTTEHKRAKKAKVSFAATMNKVLVGALIMTSLAGGATVPAQAASNKDTTLDVRLNISENYAQNPEGCTYNTDYVLSQIQSMQREGIVTNAILIELATELNTLFQAVSVSGKSASADVLAVVKKADSIIKTVVKSEENADGLAKAKAALIAFGAISVNTETQTNVTLLATKASYPTSFKDVKSGSTYYIAVNYLAKKGVIGGYKDGDFKASTNITNAKFITMLMRAVNPKLSRATKGSDWSSAIMKEAFKSGVVKADELKSENYAKSITKKDLALWTSRAISLVLKEDTDMIYGIERLIPDYSKIGSKYQESVKIVYSEGIITGSSDYSFNPSAKVTRGTAVTVIYRVINAKARKNMSKVNIPVESVEARAAMTLKWSDKNRPLPIAGDTFIDKNGKKTVLKGIKVNGYTIVGYGQNIQDLYGNMITAKGVIKDGVSGDVWNDDYTYLGSPYLIDKKTGIGYFQKDWLLISEYEGKLAEKITNPKANQRVGFWTVYNAEAFGGSWEWEGPR
jgi:hypothetical protein